MGAAVFHDGKLIHTECGIAGEPFSSGSTNNLAEYTALVKLLEFCIKSGLSRIMVFGDSQLVIRQMTGLYQVRSENILPLYLRAKILEEKFISVHFEWVKREENDLADSLSKKAYMEFIEKNIQMVPFPFGKYRGMRLCDIAKTDPSYLVFLLKKAPLREEMKNLIERVLKRNRHE